MKTTQTHTPTPWNVETEQVPFLPKNQGGGMKVRIMGATEFPPSYEGTDSQAFAQSMAQTAKRARVCTLNVGLSPEIARANAAFIVRAVNAHDALYNSALEILSIMSEMNWDLEQPGPFQRLSLAVSMAKAEGRS